MDQISSAQAGQKVLKVLIVDRHQHYITTVTNILEDDGFRVITSYADSREAFNRALASKPDIIVCEYNLDEFSGLHALMLHRNSEHQCPFILVSNVLTNDMSTQALSSGADDVLHKVHISQLASRVRRVLAEQDSLGRFCLSENADRHKELIYKQLLSQLPIAAYSTDSTGRIRLYNQAAKILWGRKPDYDNDCWRVAAQLLDSNGNDIPSGQCPMARSVREGIPRLGETVTLVRDDGSRSFIKPHIFLIHDESGAVSRGVCLLQDVTQQTLQQRNLERLNRLYAIMSSINEELLRSSNENQLMEKATSICSELGGYGVASIGRYDAAKEEIDVLAFAADGIDVDPTDLHLSTIRGQGKPSVICADAIHADKVVVIQDLAEVDVAEGSIMEKLLKSGYCSGVALPLHQNGKVWGVLALYAREKQAFTDEEIKLLKNLTDDISLVLDTTFQAKQLNFLAYYDELTGLANRHLLYDRILSEIWHAYHSEEKTALVLLNIGRFRLINQMLGRDKADEILVQVAEQLKSAAREQDTVARIEGNTFAILLAGVTDIKFVSKLCDSVSRKLNKIITIEDMDVHLKANIGIAVALDDAETAEALVLNAEAALKRAKSGVEDILFYSPEMNEEITRQIRYENKLRKALDNEQFVLHYQPKMDLKTNEVVGLEALIRWNDPEQGLVPPSEFIPVLEQTGLINEVGEWVIMQVQLDIKRWQTLQFKTPRIAVNISQIQLGKPDFVERVKELLQGNWRQGLDFEITETLIMQNFEENISKLEAIRDMGINIAVDDFGTGYSSLQYINRLPVNAMKIDRSFIKAIDEEANDVTLVSSLINLAHNLDLKVIAEGVETEEQLKILKLLKCDEVQGFYYSKPLPAHELEQQYLDTGESICSDLDTVKTASGAKSEGKFLQ